MAELIAFFSRRDENYVNGLIKVLNRGNTETAAAVLQKLTGADLFQIEPMQPYARDYNECIAQAQEDQKRNARPELKSYPESIDGYDTIYLGYPNYWGTMPMAVLAPKMLSISSLSSLRASSTRSRFRLLKPSMGKSRSVVASVILPISL